MGTEGRCYDCAWLSLTALSTVTCNLWLGVFTRCDSVQVTSHLVLACVRRPSGMQRLVVWPCCIRHVRQSG
jgi:hypothetical protein